MIFREDFGLWQYLWFMLIPLVPVVVGGLIGYGGGWLHLNRAHKLNKEKEVSSERRKQLERLVEAAYEIGAWTKRQEYHNFLGENEQIEVSSIAKIESIARLYFPSLRSKADGLAQQIQEYELHLLHGRERDIKSETGTARTEYIAQLGEHYKAIVNARDQLVEAAAQELEQLSE